MLFGFAIASLRIHICIATKHVELLGQHIETCSSSGQLRSLAHNKEGELSHPAAQTKHCNHKLFETCSVSMQPPCVPKTVTVLQLTISPSGT